MKCFFVEYKQKYLLLLNRIIDSPYAGAHLKVMMHLLVIGFAKAIRGKGLSKNKPTCENAVA